MIYKNDSKIEKTTVCLRGIEDKVGELKLWIVEARRVCADLI